MSEGESAVSGLQCYFILFIYFSLVRLVSDVSFDMNVML